MVKRVASLLRGTILIQSHSPSNGPFISVGTDGQNPYGYGLLWPVIWPCERHVCRRSEEAKQDLDL